MFLNSKLSLFHLINSNCCIYLKIPFIIHYLKIYTHTQCIFFISPPSCPLTQIRIPWPHPSPNFMSSFHSPLSPISCSYVQMCRLSIRVWTPQKSYFPEENWLPTTAASNHWSSSASNRASWVCHTGSWLASSCCRSYVCKYKCLEFMSSMALSCPQVTPFQCLTPTTFLLPLLQCCLGHVERKYGIDVSFKVEDCTVTHSPNSGPL